MSKFVKKVSSKLLPDDLEREASRIVSQADENLKDAERDIKRTLAETEDVLTGKTPDSIAAEIREAEAAQAEVLEGLREQEAEVKKKEEKRATAVGKQVSSRRRARRAGRRSLLSGGRLGTGADQQEKRTLG